MNVRELLKELEVFKSISFLEKEHKYVINEDLASKLSVTGLIGKYKPKFDEDKWARLKAKKLNISVDEMKFIWSEKNLYSTTLGTALHQIIENVYTKQEHSLDYQKIQEKLGTETYQNFKNDILAITKQFIDFFEATRSELVPLANELIIGDINNTRVCGTLDMLVYNNKERCFEIYDFKTNKAITKANEFGECFLPPLQSLEVCEFNTYSLQLSLYRYIIETYTNLKIKNLYIVWFNTRNKTYKTIPCKDLTSCAQKILR